MCDEAAQDLRFANVYEAEGQCRRLKVSGTAALNRLLDTLEPGGPKGQVQIGFTATLQLLGLYKQSGKGWEIDDAQLDNFFVSSARSNAPLCFTWPQTTLTLSGL